MSTSGRHIKKKILHEDDGPSSRSKRRRRSRNGRKYSSKRKSAEVKLMRPQRLAARNAINGFPHTSEISTDGEEECGTEGDSSGTDSSLRDTNTKTQQPVDYLQNKYLAGEQGSLNDPGAAVQHTKQIESLTNVGNKKRLVLKFTLRNSNNSLPPERIRNQSDNQTLTASFPSRDSSFSSTAVTEFLEGNKLAKIQDDLSTIAGSEENEVQLGEVKSSDRAIRISNACRYMLWQQIKFQLPLRDQ